MATRVALEHRTHYRFDRAVDLGPHLVRLRPAPHCRTPITGYSLTVDGPRHHLNWQQDVHNNHVARLVFTEPADHLSVTVDLVADMAVINPFDFFIEPAARTYPFTYPPDLREDLDPYLRRVDDPDAAPGSGPGRRLAHWLGGLRGHETPTVEFLVGINRRAAAEIAYSVRMEAGIQSPDITLQRAVGSCRDSAWLLVAALRELGLAARFVSGYLVDLAPDTASGPPGGTARSADVADLHAWAEVYVPGAGWIGLDATSGLLAGEGHIPLVATPRPQHAAPISGTVGACTTTMQHSHVVRRLREDAGVTRPYSPAQMQAVHALGDSVDAALDAGDVRLTMGGEPTYVAAGDMQSMQWRIAADGPDKHRYGLALATRLAERYAAGGITHHGQGKWYPGEALPRWQIALLWRVDGAPLWRRRDLLGEPGDDAPLLAGSAEALNAAAELTAAIAAGLGVPARCARPLHDDPLHRIVDETLLPAGDPPPRDLAAAPWLTDRYARARAVAALDNERGQPIGWAVPLARSAEGTEWVTTEWVTRRGRIHLTRGSSPAGLRLPLDSLAWDSCPPPPDRSPFAVAADLPPTPPGAPSAPAPARVVEPAKAQTTALCVQERGGHLRVFLPPLPDGTDAIEALTVIEQAAAAIGIPVVLEGYLPGPDPRLRLLTVTPDPGVVEVNVHPASSWRELVEINRTLHVAATDTGLAPETFTMTGTHIGTGGGSHLTLGGPTAVDSPLLRRPDLLVSMLTFWQHHPGLSYLFAGQFIGPTSQAPRVDEGRHETLYELEIAFAELAALSEPRPWQLDRALRHLLTDITGNTHRSEFCIDKLFSPDSERGRLGLLELRGFEMAPHPDMSLVQALLVRALVARFWAEPYRGRLVRWGTRLHDEFLLPAFVAADIASVVADLRAHGFGFEAVWLEPFFEFRFPRLGAVDVGGVSLALRAALEPWHVLGEEAAGGGTARFVDSSLQRLQVLVTGAVTDRHVITCNGVPVPLHPTPSGDALVAGVRYRAHLPASALHPTIGVHSPLVFDVVDRWNERSLGGCTYHVSHPGGRTYDRFPVNAADAESRRGARFVAEGHTAGPVDMSRWPSEASPSWALDPDAVGEYPRTLDLRRLPRPVS